MSEQESRFYHSESYISSCRKSNKYILAKNSCARHESVKQTAQPFATVYVSFYKGLGAISGAMLLGDNEFCSEARVWLRRMGGNLYSVLPYAVSSWDGFRRNCLKEVAHTNADVQQGHSQQYNLVYDPEIFEARRKKLDRVLGLMQADTMISSIVQFDPAVPEVNMVHGYLRMSYDECITALESVEKNAGIKVLTRVHSCCDTSHKINNDDHGGDDNNSEFGCRFELNFGDWNSLVDDEQYVFGWRAFAKAVNGSNV